MDKVLCIFALNKKEKSPTVMTGFPRIQNFLSAYTKSYLIIHVQLKDELNER